MMPGQHTDEILREAGLSDGEVSILWSSGALGKPQSKL